MAFSNRAFQLISLKMAISAGLIFCTAAQAFDVHSGPILDNQDAQNTCPNVCHSVGAKWNGQWTNAYGADQTVCGCRRFAPKHWVRIDLGEGPIWNNDDAYAKCPTLCHRHGYRWSQQWHTTDPGSFSVCSCLRRLNHF